MRSHSVDAGHPVTVRRWGADAGPGRRLFALHAMGPVSSGALFGCLTGPLVDAGWLVEAPDLPGYADTPPLAAEDYELSHLAELMWRVADAGGGDPVALVGHSLGGAIALRMHRERPDAVASLVLLDSGHLDYGVRDPGIGAKSLDDWLAEVSEPLAAADPDELARALELDPGDPLMADVLVAMAEEDGRLVSRADPRAAAAARFALAQSRCSEDWPALAAAATPTLLLLATRPEQARRQSEEGGAAFAAAVPQADVRLLEGATHGAVTDLREDLGRMLVDWLP